MSNLVNRGCPLDLTAALAEASKPVSIHDALLATLLGEKCGLWNMSPYKDKPAYLQRSCDLLTFFSIFSGAL